MPCSLRSDFWRFSHFSTISLIFFVDFWMIFRWFKMGAGTIYRTCLMGKSYGFRTKLSLEQYPLDSSAFTWIVPVKTVDLHSMIMYDSTWFHHPNLGGFLGNSPPNLGIDLVGLDGTWGIQHEFPIKMLDFTWLKYKTLRFNQKKLGTYPILILRPTYAWCSKNVRLCFIDSCFKLTRRDLPGKDAQGL